MDNAVAINPALPLVDSASFGGRLAALPLRSKVSAAIGVAALAAVVLAMTLWGSQADYKVLYANLSDKDGGAIIAQLSQMNVPYRHSDGGAAILVPASQVHDLRLKLATAGLPKGSVSGFELMDSARFGQTQFQERLTFQRGLEGELVRSITSMSAVENARVHLALPNQNGFFREQQQPSASVLLTLNPGRTLDRAQIAGIVHLVSSSVPEMNPKAVSILDQTGALLTSSSDGNSAGLDAQQLQYVNQIETNYDKRILELLEPLVGRDNLRATVTADVDFTQSEATSESFKPNEGADGSVAVRSKQISEQPGGGAGSGATPAGIPGASSNQPPLGATAPLVGASQPLQTTQGGAGGSAGGASGGRRDATYNYEVGKSVLVTHNASGTVKRLNAAVVVNNRSVTDAKGKTTSTPLTPEEIDKLTALVREGIGFKQERGDSVKVINAPFKVDPLVQVDVPWWKQPELIDLLRAAAMPGTLALVAMLAYFGLIRPSMRAAFAPPPQAALGAPGSRLDALVDDEQSLDGVNGVNGPNGKLGVNGSGGAGADGAGGVKALPAPRVNEHLENARTMAKDNPAAVAGIVRGWVSGEAA